MILHGERRKDLVADAFDRVVVDVYVRYLQAVGHGCGVYGEVVVLAGYLNMACREILYGMIAAMVSEL